MLRSCKDNSRSCPLSSSLPNLIYGEWHLNHSYYFVKRRLLCLQGWHPKLATESGLMQRLRKPYWHTNAPVCLCVCKQIWGVERSVHGHRHIQGKCTGALLWVEAALLKGRKPHKYPFNKLVIPAVHLSSILLQNQVILILMLAWWRECAI